MSGTTLASCPFCSAAVSFSVAQSMVQCPSCRALLTSSAPQSVPQPQQPQHQQLQQLLQQQQPAIGSMSSAALTSIGATSTPATLVRCIGCTTLLTPPPGSTTFQCPTCYALMDSSVTPSLSSSPLASLTSSVSASPFPSTSNSPLSSAPTSSTNSPASHTTTLSSLPSQSPTPLSSASASAFSTPSHSPSLGLSALPSAAVSSPASSTASPNGSSGSGSKKKRKDPQAPKRSSNAYMVFCQEHRNALKEAEPELAFGKLGKRLGEIWRNMTAEEKQPYEDRAGRDRGRYKQEMTRYQTEQMRHQMESHRLASLQQQQQRQQQQLIAAAQQHDLETRKRARIDLPLNWPIAQPQQQQQQPLMMLGQMPTAMQTSMPHSMLSAGINPLLPNQSLFSPLDPRLTGLYPTTSTSYPSAANLSAGYSSLPTFMTAGQLSLGTAPYATGSFNLPMTSMTSSMAGTFSTAPLSSLTTFANSSPTPHR